MHTLILIYRATFSQILNLDSNVFIISFLVFASMGPYYMEKFQVTKHGAMSVSSDIAWGHIMLKRVKRYIMRPYYMGTFQTIYHGAILYGNVSSDICAKTCVRNTASRCLTSWIHNTPVDVPYKKELTENWIFEFEIYSRLYLFSSTCDHMRERITNVYISDTI